MTDVIKMYKAFDGSYQEFKILLDRAIQKSRVGLGIAANEELVDSKEKAKELLTKLNALKSALDNLW